MKIPLPVIIMQEDGWFVAECPLLDIATQGKTEQEVKKNMKDLIDDYMKDPDTSKPKGIIKSVMSVSLTNIPIEIPQGVLDYGKTSQISPA